MHLTWKKQLELWEKRKQRREDCNSAKEVCWRIKTAILYSRKEEKREDTDTIKFLKRFVKKIPKWENEESIRRVLLEVTNQFLQGEISTEEAAESIENLLIVLRETEKF